MAIEVVAILQLYKSPKKKEVYIKISENIQILKSK